MQILFSYKNEFDYIYYFLPEHKKGAGSIISKPKGSGLPVRKVMIKTYTQEYMHFVHPTMESGMDIHNQLGEAMSYFFLRT